MGSQMKLINLNVKLLKNNDNSNSSIIWSEIIFYRQTQKWRSQMLTININAFTALLDIWQINNEKIC